MKYYISFLYAAISTFLYFMFLYREDVSLAALFIFQIVIFAPILLVLTEVKLSLLKLDILSILGFSFGFIIAALDAGISVWPVALAVWLVISIPVILILNITSYVYKRKHV